ncbi:AAA family ATPase [Actinoallomurus sp. CA-150999]|uniref:AAA family ATPase n=1 Tax=Actinoallomurus sp. CA-150999 TaxID=3239887 RepID=UPI003D8C5A17
MTASTVALLPYSYIVGQRALREALELAYVAPSIGGVLITGERGTAKSTTVRAFCRMVYDGRLPVTLPLNATDDRVLGGWNVDALMRGEPQRLPGLLEQANGGVLYIDEVNLLDDHLVDIILDVASTGFLVVQREGLDLPEVPVSFTLVGTMNPEEGGLRPQLLDRFGMVVPVSAEKGTARREEILLTVLRFERESVEDGSAWIAEGRERDGRWFGRLVAARARCAAVEVPVPMVRLCAQIAEDFGAAGHRGESVMARAAQARAALNERKEVTAEDVASVAPFAVAHRRPEAAYGDGIDWTPEDTARLSEIIAAG